MIRKPAVAALMLAAVCGWQGVFTLVESTQIWSSDLLQNEHADKVHKGYEFKASRGNTSRNEVMLCHARSGALTYESLYRSLRPPAARWRECASLPISEKSG